MSRKETLKMSKPKTWKYPKDIEIFKDDDSAAMISNSHTINHEKYTYVMIAEIIPTSLLKGKGAWKLAKDTARKFIRETNRHILITYTEERIKLYAFFNGSILL